MGVGNQKTDLRLLSLLHALRDNEEFIHEAHRLLKSPSLDEALWRQICEMGRDLAPQEQLFDPGKSFRDHQLDAAAIETEGGRRIVFDRRRQERRTAVRRTMADRRDGERRMLEVAWLGAQRRMDERRQYGRRQTDGLSPTSS